MKLMLLCAGEGTRLRPHTYKLPKPSIPFLTVPLGAYSIEFAREVSPSRLVVNTYHLPEKIHETFRMMNHGIADLRFSDERPLLMGPGGGIMKARPHLEGGDFLIMNGDEVFLPSSPGQLRAARDSHRKSGALATILVMRYPGVGTKFGGVWADPAGKVHGFGKSPMPGTEGFHYIGSIFFSDRVFKYLPTDRPSNILYDALVAAIAAGEDVRTSMIDGWWHETGSEADYLTATAQALPYLVEDRGYQSEFLKGILQRYSPDFRIQKNPQGVLLTADGGAPISFAFEGFCVLGFESTVAAKTMNRNLVLGDRVQSLDSKSDALFLG